MKIASLETFANEFVSFVRVTADSGEIGWGQMSTYTADITTEIFHRQIAPHAVGNECWLFSDLLDRIVEREHKYPGSYLMRAMAGLDTALWDLRGKVLGKPVVTIPGCPPNPYNFLATVVHFLTFNALPPVDELGRPKFAYSRLIHENCERRAHFDAGRFAMQFGDEGHRRGYCLYKLGCKGPETYANCPTVLFGDAGAGTWPVGCGHPCIGCTEQGIGFSKPIHMLSKVKNVEPPQQYPRIVEEQGVGATLGSASLLAAVAGAAAGAAAMVARNLGLSHQAEEAERARAASEKTEV